MRGSIRKQSEDSWQLRVYLGLVDGKRQYKSKTVKGTRKAAEAELATLITQVNSGQSMVTQKLTVKQYLEAWLRDYATYNVRQTTYDTYRMLIRLHVVPELGEKRIDRLTPLDLQSLYARKLNSGLSAKTVRHIHGVLHSAFEYAVEMDLLPRNPIRAKPPTVPKKLPTIWTLDQVLCFLDCAKSHRLYASFMLALTAGMRRGEILGLRWQDVDLQRGIIVIEQNLVPTSKGLVMQQPKTKSSRRSILIPPESVAALAEHHKQQLKERFFFDDDYQDNGLVFCRPDGQPLDPTGFVRTFKRVAKDAGLPQIRFHDLRHTHATLMLLANVNPKIVSERLGHAEIGTTMDVYSHLTTTMQAPAAVAMSQLLHRRIDGELMAKPAELGHGEDG